MASSIAPLYIHCQAPLDLLVKTAYTSFTESKTVSEQMNQQQQAAMDRMQIRHDMACDTPIKRLSDEEAEELGGIQSAICSAFDGWSDEVEAVCQMIDELQNNHFQPAKRDAILAAIGRQMVQLVAGAK